MTMSRGRWTMSRKWRAAGRMGFLMGVVWATEVCCCLFLFIFCFTFFHSKTIFTPSYNYDYNREDMKVEKGGREMEKGPKRRDSRLGPGMLFSFFFLLFSLKLNLKAIFFKKKLRLWLRQVENWGGETKRGLKWWDSPGTMLFLFFLIYIFLSNSIYRPNPFLIATTITTGRERGCLCPW
jgi:hypothetical protein